MSGVRLHHPDLRSVTYTITNYAVRLKAPMFCWVCSGGPESEPHPRTVIHEYKTIHLNIDAVGDVVVAEGIYEMMQRTGLLRSFTTTKLITSPDPMVLDMGNRSVPLVVDEEKGVLNGKFPS